MATITYFDLIFLGIILCLILFAFIEIRRTRHYLAQSNYYKGKIVRHRADSGMYFNIYQYTDSDGQIIEFESSLGRQKVHNHPIGKDVGIAVHPETKERKIMTFNALYWLPMVLFVVAGFLIYIHGYKTIIALFSGSSFPKLPLPF